MLNPKDVRIGNLIQSITGEIETVCGIHEKTVRTRHATGQKVYSSEYEDVRGIVITKDILINKCGFVDDSLPEKYVSLGVTNCLKLDNLRISFDDGFWFVVRRYDNIQHYAVSKGFQYIHQLQNIYYFKEFQELIIKD